MAHANLLEVEYEMELRDRFAASVFPVLLGRWMSDPKESDRQLNDDVPLKKLAATSYRIADVVMEERQAQLRSGVNAAVERRDNGPDLDEIEGLMRTGSKMS